MARPRLGCGSVRARDARARAVPVQIGPPRGHAEHRRLGACLAAGMLQLRRATERTGKVPGVCPLVSCSPPAQALTKSSSEIGSGSPGPRWGDRQVGGRQMSTRRLGGQPRCSSRRLASRTEHPEARGPTAWLVTATHSVRRSDCRSQQMCRRHLSSSSGSICSGASPIEIRKRTLQRRGCAGADVRLDRADALARTRPTSAGLTVRYASSRAAVKASAQAGPPLSPYGHHRSPSSRAPSPQACHSGQAGPHCA